jgi:hypothetical protein
MKCYCNPNPSMNCIIQSNVDSVELHIYTGVVFRGVTVLV